MVFFHFPYTIIVNEQKATVKGSQESDGCLSLPGNKIHKYTFTNWDKEITVVSGDVTYTALYKQELVEYTVTFKYFWSLVNRTVTSDPAEHILVIYVNPF